MITCAVLRVVASVVVVTVLYYLLPFDRSATGLAVTLLVARLVMFIGLVASQVRAIIVSPFPGLTRTDALYFTVTIFSTVGFGDISAKAETARLVVTGQMIADLLVLGLAIKAIVSAARRGQQRRPPDTSHAT